MSLQDQGFRYLVNREKDRYGWFHPADVEPLKQQGWVDCTDMSDVELKKYFSGD